MLFLFKTNSSIQPENLTKIIKDSLFYSFVYYLQFYENKPWINQNKEPNTFNEESLTYSMQASSVNHGGQSAPHCVIMMVESANLASFN